PGCAAAFDGLQILASLVMAACNDHGRSRSCRRDGEPRIRLGSATPTPVGCHSKRGYARMTRSSAVAKPSTRGVQTTVWWDSSWPSIDCRSMHSAQWPRSSHWPVLGQATLPLMTVRRALTRIGAPQVDSSETSFITDGVLVLLATVAESSTAGIRPNYGLWSTKLRRSRQTSRLEDHKRNLAGRPLLVALVSGIDLDRLRPEACALRRIGDARPDRMAGRADLNARVRVRFQVVKPRRVARMATLRRDDDDVLAVADVDQRSCSPDTGPRSDMVEQQHRWTTAKAMTDPPAGRSIDQHVQLRRVAENRPQPVGVARVVHLGVTIVAPASALAAGWLRGESWAGAGRRRQAWRMRLPSGHPCQRAVRTVGAAVREDVGEPP